MKRILTLIRSLTETGGDAADDEIRTIEASGLFDLDWYVEHAGERMTLRQAIAHYLETGASQGLDPNRYFLGAWYLDTYPGVRAAGRNPLLDYISGGEAAGRRPNPDFDPHWHLTRYPDLGAVQGLLLRHYMSHGVREGRHPSLEALLARSGLFDLEHYNAQTPEKRDLAEAVRHYIDQGVALGLNPNAYFDTSWYLDLNPGVAASGVNPLAHYIESGEAEGRAPGPDFDAAWYRRRYPDVRSSPLAHFVTSGAKDGRHPNALAENPEARARMLAIDSDVLPSDMDTIVRLKLTLVSLEDAVQKYSWDRQDSGWVSAAEAGGRPGIAFPSPPIIVHARDVGVLGGSRLMVSRDNDLIDDELSIFSGSGVALKRKNMLRKGRDVDIAVIRKYGTRLERGVHLMHEYDANYFHFVTEVLPRALIASQDPDIPGEAPFLVSANIHPNFRELLTGVAGPDRALRELERDVVYYAQDVWYCTDASTIQDVYTRRRRPEETQIHTTLVRAVRDRFLQSLTMPTAPRRSRRLYLWRGARMRSLRNEAAVSEALAARGFETLSLEGLSAAAQARIFSEAEIVVGPTGAAITNLIWCQPGTPVIVLAANHPAMPREVWSQLGEVSGCDVRVTSETQAQSSGGLYSLHEDFGVEITRLTALIDSIL